MSLTPEESEADSKTCEPLPFPVAERSQIDFDISFYGSVLERSPEYVDVLRCQAELLARKGDYTRALSVEQRLASLLPFDPIVRYNLACTYAKGGFISEALQSLRSSLELGYSDFDYLDSDADLDALRNLPQFEMMLRAFKIQS